MVRSFEAAASELLAARKGGGRDGVGEERGGIV